MSKWPYKHYYIASVLILTNIMAHITLLKDNISINMINKDIGIIDLTNNTDILVFAGSAIMGSNSLALPDAILPICLNSTVKMSSANPTVEKLHILVHCYTFSF